VKSVGGDEDPRLQLSGGCLQIDGALPSRKAREGGFPSDLDSGPGSRLRQCRREGRLRPVRGRAPVSSFSSPLPAGRKGKVIMKRNLISNALLALGSGTLALGLIACASSGPSGRLSAPRRDSGISHPS